MEHATSLTGEGGEETKNRYNFRCLAEISTKRAVWSLY
jgi:hypothetical protein